MKKEDAEKHERKQRAEERGRAEWRTGTVIDRYTAIYEALFSLGRITPDVAAGMDLTVIAVFLGVPADGSRDQATAVAEPQPLLSDGTPAPATAPPGIRPPKWWRGNDNAFRSATAGARELGMAPVAPTGDEAPPSEGRVTE